MLISRSSSGGATTTSPQGGWKNPALGAIFSHTLPRDNYVYPKPGANQSQPTPSPSPSPSPQPSSSNTGAIAGGVVGGVIALALIGLAIWFFTWRPKNRQNGRSGNWNKPELHGNEVHAEAKVGPRELEPNSRPAQLETKTDRAELDAYQYAMAMQGVQEPFEMDAGSRGQQDQSVELHQTA